MYNSHITISGESFELVERSCPGSEVSRYDLITNDKSKLPIATIIFDSQAPTDLSLQNARVALSSYKKNNGEYSIKPKVDEGQMDSLDVSYEDLFSDVISGEASASIVQYFSLKPSNNDIWFIEVETRTSSSKSYRVAIWDMDMGSRVLEARVRREDARTFVYGPYDTLVSKSKCGRQPLSMNDIYKKGA